MCDNDGVIMSLNFQMHSGGVMIEGGGYDGHYGKSRFT